jgi:threonine/homoserine/homoserine lactone efflux protein
MGKLFKVLLTGLLVSFLGSLPLGTLNVAAMQISIAEGVGAAVQFSMGSLLAEVIYVRLSLVAMDWIRKQTRLLLFFDWVTFALLVVLSVSSLYAAIHPSIHSANPILNSALPKVGLGFLMSAINPVQIPYWFGWSSVLLAKGFLSPQPLQYNFYIVGIGLGTLLGNCVFIYGGQIVAASIANQQNVVSLVVGLVFLFSAGWQLYRLVRKKDAVHRLNTPQDDTKRAADQIEKWEENWFKK